MKSESEISKDATILAIQKHREIIKELEDIITLNYNGFKIVNDSGYEMKDLEIIEFALWNIKEKVKRVKLYEDQIKQCYDQTGIFNSKQQLDHENRK